MVRKILKMLKISKRNCPFTDKMHLGTQLSNGHSPQIRHNGELLVRMCRGESHLSQKSPLANVGESGESGQSSLANVDECIESGQSRLANVGECIESDQNRLANFGASKIGRFMHK